jgi:hypothetical protein
MSLTLIGLILWIIFGLALALAILLVIAGGLVKDPVPDWRARHHRQLSDALERDDKLRDDRFSQRYAKERAAWERALGPKPPNGQPPGKHPCSSVSIRG